MQEPEVVRSVNIRSDEVVAEISYEESNCTIICAVNFSFIERECAGLEDKQIAVAALQFIVQRDGIFVAGSPSLKLTPRNADAGLNFTAAFPVLLKPILDPHQLVEELKNSLSEEDLESEDECRKRLLAIVESKITYPLPHEFLANSGNPLDAISLWKRSIALATLSDIYPSDNLLSANYSDKAENCISWILSNAIKVSTK